MFAQLTMLLKTCCNEITRWYRFITLVLLSAILITACQASTQNPQVKGSLQRSTDCQVVEHAAGKSEICGKPRKIAVLEPKLLSMVLALDVQPAAYADAYFLRLRQFNNPGQQIPYLGNFVTSQPMNLGDRNNPSLENLTLLKPDLILGLSFQQNVLFSSIAPSVLIDNTEMDWQYNIQTVAKALNLENKVQSVIASYRQQIAEARTRLAPIASTHPRVLNIICDQAISYIEVQYRGDAVQLFEKLGFQPVLLEDVEQKLGVRPVVNLETLSQLDADIIIVHTWLDQWNGNSTYEVPLETLKQKWIKNPLLHYSRAWKEGRVYFVDYQLWGSVIGGPIADSLILEQLPKLLLSPTQSN
jgi:iron complex transport system substrate-binding protein